MVKKGRIIYVTVNSAKSPTLPIPDLIDNSSYREAEAKLVAMGFKLLPPKRILGERDWVLGIISHGRQVSTGDHVSIESPLTLVIGNGQYGENDDIDYTEPEYIYPEEKVMIGIDVDDFEEVEETGKPTKIDESGINDIRYGQ